MSEAKVGDVRNMSSARDIADVFAGPEIGWVTCNLKGACRLLAGLIGREREAAREMREVLRECEWSGDVHTYAACPCCHCLQPCQLPEGDEFAEFRSHYHEGHAPDCRLARLIGDDRG